MYIPVYLYVRCFKEALGPPKESPSFIGEGRRVEEEKNVYQTNDKEKREYNYNCIMYMYTIK